MHSRYTFHQFTPWESNPQPWNCSHQLTRSWNFHCTALYTQSIPQHTVHSFIYIFNMVLRFFEVQIQRTDVCCYTTVFEGKFNWKTMWPHAVSCRLSKFTSPQINHQCKVMHMEWKVPKVCNMITLCSMQSVFFLGGQLSNKTLHLQHIVYKGTYAYMHFHTCKQTLVVKMQMQTCNYRHACRQSILINIDGRWQLDLVDRYKPSWYLWCQVSFSHKK